jgi:hypothetical protein
MLAVLHGRTRGGNVVLDGAGGENLDWKYLVWAAERLGVLPLLGEALARGGPPRAASVDVRCQKERLRGALRALVAERVLEEIDAGFRSEGIPFMILKGLPLAQELYGEPALRSMDDVDVLVPSAMRQQALLALQRIGFRPPPGSLSLRFYLRHHFHAMLIREPLRGLPVELHWDTQPFFSLSRIPEAEFWKRPRIRRVGPVDVSVPGREQEFLYLVQHLSRHLLGWGPEVAADPVAVLLEPTRRGRLTWLSDLYLLLRAEPPLDRGRMAGLAESWGLSGELRAALHLLEAPDRRPIASSTEEHSPASHRTSEASGRRAARLIPWFRRSSPALQFRPVLVVYLLRYAFPGPAFIRNRYSDRVTGAVTLAWFTLSHAFQVLLKATRLAGAFLIESLQKALLPRRFRRHVGRLPGVGGS